MTTNAMTPSEKAIDQFETGWQFSAYEEYKRPHRFNEWLWSGGIFFPAEELEANPDREQFTALLDAKLDFLRHSLLAEWGERYG